MKNQIFTYFIILIMLVGCSKKIIQVSQKVQASEQYKGPIIDMHLHAYNEPNPLLGEATNPVTGEKRNGAGTLLQHMERTFEIMDQYNIVLGVISAPDGSNDVLLKWREERPGSFLIGQSVVNPNEIDQDKITAQKKKGELDVMGEVMPNYAGILPNDPSVKLVFEIAQTLNLPLGYHLFPGGPPGGAYFAYPSIRAIQAKPLLMEEVLLQYPKVKVFIMHAGWPYLEDMKALLYAHPQVYVEVSALSWILPADEVQLYIKGLIDAGFGKRIMFGSDQMTWPEEIVNSIGAINSAEFLTLEQKADIFYNNAAMFLGLSKEEITKHKAHNKRSMH